jgi:hypothetical protein
MRNFLRTAAAAIGLIVLAAPALGQSDARGSWQAMTFHDFRTPSKTDVLQTLVWPDAITEANAYATNQLRRPLNGKNALVTALSSTYQLGDRTVIISAALVRGCDSGANDKGAEIEPSVCPLRIVVLTDGKVISSKSDTGCYADHSDPDLPEENRTNNSYTLFDPKTGTIAYRTTIGGKAIANCERTYSIN